MTVDSVALEASIDVLPDQGVARIQDAFDPRLLYDDFVSPYARHKRWEGTDFAILDNAGVASLNPESRQFISTLAKVAVHSGFEDWQPNYVMKKTTTEGIDLHPDRTAFRHFTFFAYLLGRTDFYYESGRQKPKQLVLNPGDILVMRQSTNVSDTDTRVRHRVGASGLRAFVNISFINKEPSVYPIEPMVTRPE